MGAGPSKTDLDAPGALASERAREAAPAREAARADGVVIATHAVLFATDDRALCDACEQVVDLEADGAGVGLYVWTRGTEVRYEEPPLCASCASAIGLSALGRSEIEEEEG